VADEKGQSTTILGRYQSRENRPCSGFGSFLVRTGFSPSEFRWGIAAPFVFRDPVCLDYADRLKPVLTEGKVEASTVGEKLDRKKLLR
jgi:hypothetical protein